MAAAEDRNAGSQDWFIERFDRFDDQLRNGLKELRDEVVNTRHAQKASLDTMALQLATLVTEVSNAKARIEVINQWRADGGPLDQKFMRIQAASAEALRQVTTDFTTAMREHARDNRTEFDANDRQHVDHIAWRNRIAGAVAILSVLFVAGVSVIAAQWAGKL